jgi:hypothetical protein
MQESGMTSRERRILVDDYIGEAGGYLRGFSYNDHESFYHRYCDLDFEVAELRKRHGSTRRTFEAILKDAAPHEQAKIIRGTIAKVSTSPYYSKDEKGDLERQLLEIASRLELGGHVPSPVLNSTTETVRMALDSAELLLKERGPIHALDRAHTALHGHLKKICADRKIPLVKTDPDMMEIFGLLRDHCPELKAAAHDEHAKKLFRSVASGLDSLNYIRNRGTLSHPNDLLLGSEEAALFINL